MSRQRGQPRRAVSQVSALHSLRVFVEGNTEENYLIGWAREYRETVNVAVSPYRGGPLQLVGHAIDAKVGDEKKAKRKQGAVYDEYWCIFDVDEHANFAEAIRLAKDNDIRLAISNPCIELWFILHYELEAAWIDRHVAQSRSKKLLRCDKSLTSEAREELTTSYADAKKHALYLDKKHDGDGSPPGSNPSSGVWRIVDSIRGNP
ncbi:MAG: RloB family protein [Ilumatobacteraceae bacterium]